MTLFDALFVIGEQLLFALGSILLMTAGMAVALSLFMFFLELPEKIKDWWETRNSIPEEDHQDISTVFIHKPIPNETRLQNNSETTKKRSRKTTKDGSAV